MELTKTKNSKSAKELYLRAFPKEERLPWSVLRLSAWMPGVELTSYYHDGEFCGFTHTTSTEDVLFVMFLAVHETTRGIGCGSAILTHLKQENPEKAIILNVEPLEDTAPNLRERINRMAFYQKNGFYDTGYQISEVGGTFQVLSTEPTLDVPAYQKVFRKLSFGIWRPAIWKNS